MATLAQFEQDKNQQNATQGGTGQVLNSTAGGGATGVASTTPTGAYNPPRTPLSGTPNIQQYLQANQGVGQRLAGGIESNVQRQAGNLQQDVNAYQQNLQKQYQPLQQTEQQGQQVIQTAFQNPQQLLDAYNASKSQQPGQAITPDQQTSLQQYNQFQALNNPNQAGGLSQQIAGYGTSTQAAQNALQNQLSALQQQTGQANTEMGRANLLQSTIGQPNYNMGQQTLDALFLQAQPGVTNQLRQNLGTIAGEAQQNVGGLSSDAQSKLAALQALSAQNQQQIQSQFGAGLGDIAKNVQSEYTAAQQNAADVQKGFQDAFQTGSYTPEQLKALGLQQGQQTWGLTGQDLMNAAGFQTNQLAQGPGGLAQAATPEEFARYNALNQLAGGPAGTMQSNIFGSATAAGGYTPYTLSKPEGIKESIDKNAQLYGITKVNDMIDQMRQQGYFRGSEDGGGFQAADPQAPFRAAMGKALNEMERTSKEGAYDPNKYYTDVLNAVKQAGSSAGLGVNPNLQNFRSDFFPLLKQLGDYQKSLAAVQSQKINEPSGTFPGGIHDKP